MAETTRFKIALTLTVRANDPSEDIDQYWLEDLIRNFLHQQPDNLLVEEIVAERIY